LFRNQQRNNIPSAIELISTRFWPIWLFELKLEGLRFENGDAMEDNMNHSLEEGIIGGKNN